MEGGWKEGKRRVEGGDTFLLDGIAENSEVACRNMRKMKDYRIEVEEIQK